MDELTQRTIVRFQRALAALRKAAALSGLPNHAERDAVLLRFQLVAELMPKMLRRIVRERGGEAALPKDAVREARRGEIITADVAYRLLQAIDDRNRMVHDYNDDFADALLVRVKADYIPAFNELLDGAQGSARSTP